MTFPTWLKINKTKNNICTAQKTIQFALRYVFFYIEWKHDEKLNNFSTCKIEFWYENSRCKLELSAKDLQIPPTLPMIEPKHKFHEKGNNSCNSGNNHNENCRCTSSHGWKHYCNVSEILVIPVYSHNSWVV